MDKKTLQIKKNILITINLFLIHEISCIVIYFLGFNSLQLFMSVYKV